MVDVHWTPKLVEAYLAEAADTLRRLPEERVQTARSSWPPIVHEACDAYGWEAAETRPGPPAAKAIDQMDRTLLWLRWLDREDQKLVWDRACGLPWKAITHKYGFDRSTGWRRWTYALVTIAARLNAEFVATPLQHHPMQHLPARCDSF